MVKEPYFDSNEVQKRFLSDSNLEEDEFIRYGFVSVSFLHVALAKLFFLPIILVILTCFTFMALVLKLTLKSSIWLKLFSLSLYCLFFNIPLRYLIEMFQDLLIAAFVNVWLIGINTHSKPLQIANFILSLLFILFIIAIFIFILIIGYK